MWNLPAKVDFPPADLVAMGKKHATEEADSEVVPNWDEYFSQIAKAVSKKSKDDCQVGAVIVHPEAKTILSTGYNGLPRNVLDKANRITDDLEKLSWTCHAEANAIYNSARVGTAIDGAHIYVTKFPCVQCAAAIVQANIERVYTLDKKPWTKDPPDDGKGGRATKILQEAGVQIHALEFDDPKDRNYNGPSPSTSELDDPTKPRLRSAP